jgi:hypothetical protein
VAARTADSISSATVELVVDAKGADMERAERRVSLLKRIALETGGRYFDIKDLSGLPAEVAASKAGVTERDAQDLWDMPFTLILFLTLMAAEWGYRRWRGLA